MNDVAGGKSPSLQPNFLKVGHVDKRRVEDCMHNLGTESPEGKFFMMSLHTNKGKNCSIPVKPVQTSPRP